MAGRKSMPRPFKAATRDAAGHAKARTDEPLSLTARQKEVLRLVALGHTNREIGGQLEISVRTVEVHRFNLMRRLRVRNVAQLIRQGMLLRLIPKPAATGRPAPPHHKIGGQVHGHSSSSLPRHSANEP